MKNIDSYLAQNRNARLVSSLVRTSLAQTLAAKLAARAVVLAGASALFFLVSPAAGFVALAVGIFLL